MSTSEDLLICAACGTQFDVPASTPLKGCRICDDPRQFVPPQGQTWTSLGQMRGKYENAWEQDEFDERVWSVWTKPKFAIGQRAILIETPSGNILWDLITYLDQPTVDFIKSRGGLKAIVISHPHYYTTHVDWAAAFDCPIYVSPEDEEWLNRSTISSDQRRHITSTTQDVVPGVTAIKVGGHFPGSLVLLWEKKLFIADSLVTVPSALYHVDRPKGTTSYSFMWSIPNMIPLPPGELMRMWKALKPHDFESTHGAFTGMDVRSPLVKQRVLESMQIQVRFATGVDEGYEILDE
ncbi:hypothetical protein K431DRAFT_344872 [Polychaeton citri CBS 116435]|uniref:Metallo-beta-lactamase domain-containing protein n=1 Tax=Polychaeton citri CBS 116435 TaxID=1314669 RepID=A0A9P4QEE4_9PEZI|nr:hypothetical protein K431DRAFT_344872 [Polychaeton citri CBS 116435]